MLIHYTVRTALGRKEIIAPKKNKAARKDGAQGVITGVLGKRKQYFLVMHEGASVPAVYLPEELSLETKAYWRLTYQQHGIGYFTEVPTYLMAQDALEELKMDNGNITDAVIEGPFFSDKELKEGLIATRTLFDRLKD